MNTTNTPYSSEEDNDYATPTTTAASANTHSTIQHSRSFNNCDRESYSSLSEEEEEQQTNEQTYRHTSSLTIAMMMKQ